MVAPSTTGTTPSTKRKRDCLESGAKVVQAGKPFSFAASEFIHGSSSIKSLLQLH